MIIKRDIYLNRLIRSKGDGFVKIVTGIRRCGKSYLLFKLFKSHLLKEGVNKKNIVEIALDKRKDAKFRDPDVMYGFLTEKTKNARSRVYILIDEIQECKRPKQGNAESTDERASREQEFYDILNEFRERKNVDLYVTGSNSRLLVTDVATHNRSPFPRRQIHGTKFHPRTADFGTILRNQAKEGWFPSEAGLRMTLRHSRIEVDCGMERE